MSRTLHILLFTISNCFFLLGHGQAAKPEFRAAWVASVSNIDWPSKSGLSVEYQKLEFTSLLDMHKKNGLNAVVVQIRPAADAFYPSQYEPWSEYLTGTQGKAPYPFYDPLQFMIEETHKRGMEFHAWVNPYRAVFNTARSSIAGNHPTKINKDWFINFDGKKLFDPGNPDARRFVVGVIEDIVKRYDVDGIHIDDYFYPYPVAGKPFADGDSYRKYGNNMDKDDWRRSNVDSAILGIHKAILRQKPWVKFGVSPFGVWRNQSDDPEGSATRAGVKNYDDLYADILLWLEEGWIDYVAPQLYWEIGHRLCDYATLIDWWAKHTYGKHCYVGIGIYRATEPNRSAGWRDKTMLPRMIQLARSTPGIEGEIYYSSKSFINNPNGWNDSLQDNYYKQPAPIPTMAWLGTRHAKIWDTTFAHEGKNYKASMKDGGRYKVITVTQQNTVVLQDSLDNYIGQGKLAITDFDGNGFPDLVLTTMGETPSTAVYLWANEWKSFKKVEGMENFPQPKKIAGQRDLYYSYQNIDCGNANWASDLFTIKNNKATALASMDAEGCEVPITTLSISKAGSTSKTPLETRSFDPANDRFKFLAEYWKEKHSKFLN